ncbi:tetratricopeptide repeat protein [Streptomyces sp.]|uniref:tetratricopeptide repeat protein n=1 Tax=Streptomyces sp. TaxID=1931 RepID=UPI002F409097
MGAVRILLPRALARVSTRAGGPLLGAALLRCLAPRWVLVRPQPAARRLAWGEEAVAVYRALVTRGRPRRRHRDGLARALALYANALLLNGRYEEALAVADESLAVPGARPSPTQTAYTLHVRALALAETDWLDEALTVARECVAAYRHTMPRRRDRPLENLVGAQRTCAWVLGRLGRVAESVTAYQECAVPMRDMSLRQLLRVRMVQVRVLIELTGGLRALGRCDEAVETGADAREWCDSPVLRLYPEILPLRVRLLTDLAWCHGATGDLSRARETAEQAVAVCRTLAERDPATGEPWLVLALECLAHHLGRLDAPAGEQLALRELADLCARLTGTRPDAYEPRLARALDDLAFRHWHDGARRQAVEATERSVAAYRRAAGRHPQAYEPDLARTLANLSIRQRGAGGGDDAVANAREALAITRRLAESDWDTYQSLTAQRLRTLARALRRTGDEAGALACYEEAETVLRELMEDADPGSYAYEAALAAILTDLADTLRMMAEAHLTAGRSDDAVRALRHLLALTRRAEQTDVHAACLTAFARARALAPDEVRRAWQRATADPFPSFVYRAPFV